jgi:rubrerythrin
MDWTAEVLVHAIAVEREAARRYRELARFLGERHQAEAAALFAELARQDERHLQRLEAKSASVALPELASDHSWGAGAGPIASALQAEKDARAFFEQAGRVANEASARLLAEEMAAEENEHIARIQALVSGQIDERSSS